MNQPFGTNPTHGRKKGISTKKIILIVVVLTLIPIIITVAIFAMVVGGLYFGTKNTEEFTCAMSEINKNEKAVEILGKPIVDGYLVLPNIEISGSRREVQFRVPVSGSKSGGTLYVTSYRDNFRSDFLAYLETDSEKVEIHRGNFPCNE